MQASGGGTALDGKISNFRIIVGTALYTDAFTPPVTELELTPTTKFLGLQSDSSVTETLVTPGTVTANGDPQATSSGSWFNIFKQVFLPQILR